MIHHISGVFSRKDNDNKKKKHGFEKSISIFGLRSKVAASGSMYGNTERGGGSNPLVQRPRRSSWGPFLTSTLWANFDPQGQSCPQGVNFVPWGWS
jgi:hypothetical protein